MTGIDARVLFTEHACARVRGRLRLAPTDEQLARIVAEGRITSTAPAGSFDWGAHTAIAFLVTHDAVFPLASGDDPNSYVAITCVRRPRLSKAERRARRAAARAERDWSDAA